MPSYFDEEGHPVTVSINPTLAFVSLTGDVIHIAPTLFTEVGEHSLNIVLTDTEPISKTYPITITVTNSAPVFTGIIKLTDYTIKLNDYFDYILPPYADDENNPVFITLTPSLSHVQLKDSII